MIKYNVTMKVVLCSIIIAVAFFASPYIAKKLYHFHKKALHGNKLKFDSSEFLLNKSFSVVSERFGSYTLIHDEFESLVVVIEPIPDSAETILGLQEYPHKKSTKNGCDVYFQTNEIKDPTLSVVLTMDYDNGLLYRSNSTDSLKIVDFTNCRFLMPLGT